MENKCRVKAQSLVFVLAVVGGWEWVVVVPEKGTEKGDGCWNKHGVKIGKSSLKILDHVSL